VLKLGDTIWRVDFVSVFDLFHSNYMRGIRHATADYVAVVLTLIINMTDQSICTAFVCYWLAS